MMASVFMALMVDFECGQKRLRFAHFQDDPMELVGRNWLALTDRKGISGGIAPPQPRIPMMSGIWHIDSGPEKSVAFPLGIRAYDAEHVTADADLHPLSGHHRNALHQMRRADAAGADRAAQAALRLADLPLRPL